VLLFPDQETHPSGKDVETLGQGRVKVGGCHPSPGPNVELDEEYPLRMLSGVRDDHGPLTGHGILEGLTAPTHPVASIVRPHMSARLMVERAESGAALAERGGGVG
jgi:hypothetical protein